MPVKMATSPAVVFWKAPIGPSKKYSRERAVTLADGVDGKRTSGSFSRWRRSAAKCSGATNAHISLPAPLPVWLPLIARSMPSLAP